MGLFSFFSKVKNKSTVETSFGIFELAYSKRNKNIWTNNSREYSISIQGTNKEPNAMQLRFIGALESKIQHLNEVITLKLINEFKEAESNIGFTDWEQRFKIVAIEVMLIYQEENYWNITLEDTQKPYSHFTLYIEGQKITDFSIDT